MELALVLPIMLLGVLGAFELGRLYTAEIAITNASREGAFYASNGANIYNTIEIRNRVVLAAAGLDANNVAVSTSSTATTVTVTVTYTMAPLTPFAALFIGNPATLTAQTTARLMT